MPQHLPAFLHPRGMPQKPSAPRWRPKRNAPRPPPPHLAGAFRVPSFRTTATGKRIRDDGVVLWGAGKLRTSLVGKRPAVLEVAALSPCYFAVLSGDLIQKRITEKKVFSTILKCLSQL